MELGRGEREYKLEISLTVYSNTFLGCWRGVRVAHGDWTPLPASLSVCQHKKASVIAAVSKYFLSSSSSSFNPIFIQ